MATIFNPWQSPPTENTLETPLASFDINGMEGPEDAPESGEAEGGGHEKEHGGAMAQALAVVQQQSDIIAQLMVMMSGKK